MGLVGQLGSIGGLSDFAKSLVGLSGLILSQRGPLLGSLDEIIDESLGREGGVLFLIGESGGVLVLEDHFLEGVGIYALLLVVREDLALGLDSRHLTEFLHIAESLLLLAELLDAVGELAVAEFILGEVLIARDHGVELEGTLVRRAQVTQEVLHVDAGILLVGAILGLLGLAS